MVPIFVLLAEVPLNKDPILLVVPILNVPLLAVVLFNLKPTSETFASVQIPGNCARVARGFAVINSVLYAMASSHSFRYRAALACKPETAIFFARTTAVSVVGISLDTSV